MKISQNTWVEIHQIILKPEERAPQVPNDTKTVPLELKARGFLSNDAEIGDEVVITTLVGRQLKGKLIYAEPSYQHTFGTPHTETLSIGKEVKAILRGEK